MRKNIQHLKYRYSIGYFHELKEEGKHYGIFRLAIINFGKTIYEKFSDKDCPNPEVVGKMRDLSSKYTKSGFFRTKSFEEETLWTLYALQEGVTSVSPLVYQNRGNGSIQFIHSFFNLKGPQNDTEQISRMAIMSGNAKINFDGTYQIVEKTREGSIFKFMTFNNSGDIEDKPDNKFVKFAESYFPGTIISAKIYFNKS